LQLFDQNGYPVGNKFSKHVAVIWVNDSFNFPKYTSELSPFFNLEEYNNSPFSSYTTNRFNGLAVNDSLIFAYDGKV
jgi:hypothetical protein